MSNWKCTFREKYGGTWGIILFYFFTEQRSPNVRLESFFFFFSKSLDNRSSCIFFYWFSKSSSSQSFFTLRYQCLCVRTYVCVASFGSLNAANQHTSNTAFKASFRMVKLTCLFILILYIYRFKLWTGQTVECTLSSLDSW